MACACQGNQPSEPEPQYEVTLPNGQRKTVTGEHAAKVAVTMAGGGSYRKL